MSDIGMNIKFNDIVNRDQCIQQYWKDKFMRFPLFLNQFFNSLKHHAVWPFPDGLIFLFRFDYACISIYLSEWWLCILYQWWLYSFIHDAIKPHHSEARSQCKLWLNGFAQQVGTQDLFIGGMAPSQDGWKANPHPGVENHHFSFA